MRAPLAVGVNVIRSISLSTVAAYRLDALPHWLGLPKVGLSDPDDKESAVKQGSNRVTTRVYLAVALLSRVLTEMTMVLFPTFTGAAFPVIDIPLAVMKTLCLALLAVGVNVICSVSLATVAVYRVDALPH